VRFLAGSIGTDYGEVGIRMAPRHVETGTSYPLRVRLTRNWTNGRSLVTEIT
jgi:hypothetical protein